MTPQIRSFQNADRSAVLALWTELLADGSPHNDPATALAKKLAVDPELLLVAIAGDAVVGTVMGGYDGHRGWVYSLAVDPACRRRGIGRALMLAVEQRLTTLGCLKLNLQVRSTNTAVIAFYDKLGFAVEPRASLGKTLY